MTDQSPSPTNVVWDDAPKPGAAPPAPTPAVTPSATPGVSPATANEPTRAHVIWDPPTKSEWDTDSALPESMEQSKYHTLKAVARGFIGVLGEMTGDKPAEIEARNKKLRIDDPYATWDDRNAQMAGGLAVPVPGVAEAGPLSVARLADQAGTLGQKTGSAVVQMIEKTLARLPGGGSLVKSWQLQSERLAHTSEDIVQNLGGGADTSATGAGQTLKGQLGEAAKRMKAEAAAHYDEVEKLIPPGTHVGVSSTLNTLKEITTPVAGAEQTTGALLNPKLVKIREALDADIKTAGSEHLPYSVLKQLRTKIGEQIEWGPFSTDPANGQMKQVYSSLTADMNNGAASVSTEAAQAVRKANAAYAVSKEQQKILNTVINKAGGPEKVFTSLMAGTKEGATTLKEVLSAIDQPSRNVLAASALQRMGRATAGAQDIAGTVFSPDTFLTNWNKMSPEARSALFDSLPGGYAKNVTKFAENVSRLKEYLKVLPNPSNTAQAALWGGALSAGITALLTGNPLLAAKIAALPAGTKMLSAALTNPQTVKWLAAETSRLLPPAVQGEAAFNAPTDKAQGLYEDLRQYATGSAELEQLTR